MSLIQTHLETMFNPKIVAVIGASDNPTKALGASEIPEGPGVAVLPGQAAMPLANLVKSRHIKLGPKT